MPLSKKTKIICSSFLSCLFLLIGWGGYLHYKYHYKIIWKHQENREKEYREIEESFIKSPNIYEAGILMDYYHGDRNYKKALYFGKECIKLGVNDLPIGFSINYQLALIYKEIGDIDLAREHLKTVLLLDKDQRILKSNSINRDKLIDLLSKEELEAFFKG